MTHYRNHAEEIEAVRHLAETERLNGHLFPNHMPEGKAAPRWIDSEAWADARQRIWWFIEDFIGVAAIATIFVGWMIFAAVQTPDLTGIPEYNQSP